MPDWFSMIDLVCIYQVILLLSKMEIIVIVIFFVWIYHPQNVFNVLFLQFQYKFYKQLDLLSYGTMILNMI